MPLERESMALNSALDGINGTNWRSPIKPQDARSRRATCALGSGEHLSPGPLPCLPADQRPGPREACWQPHAGIPTLGASARS